MAGEFQKSIDFFLASHPDTSIGKIYLSGGSARVPPLLAAIEQRARVPVEIDGAVPRRRRAPNIDPRIFAQPRRRRRWCHWGSRSRRPGDKF